MKPNFSAAEQNLGYGLVEAVRKTGERKVA
jgi:hypothetical protein